MFTVKDANHWPWYLHDLKTLELNNKQELTNTLRFIWCDDISPSRKLSYELIGLVSESNVFENMPITREMNEIALIVVEKVLMLLINLWISLN